MSSKNLVKSVATLTVAFGFAATPALAADRGGASPADQKLYWSFYKAGVQDGCAQWKPSRTVYQTLGPDEKRVAAAGYFLGQTHVQSDRTEYCDGVLSRPEAISAWKDNFIVPDHSVAFASADNRSPLLR